MTIWKGFPEAQKHLDAAIEVLLTKVHSVDRANALYGLGGLAVLTDNIEQALDYLEQAIALKEGIIDWALNDIAWLDRRNDTRFQALISNELRENGGKVTIR